MKIAGKEVRVFRMLAQISGVFVLLALVGAAGFLLVVPERNPDGGDPPPVDTAVAEEAYSEAIGNTRALVSALRKESLYPSISSAVVVDGAPVWREAIGFASLETRTPASVDTRYPIGSISKPLTATIAMLLVENGALSLDSPIESYLLSVPTHYRGVTTRQLLSHQAGVRHYQKTFSPPYFSESGLNVEYPCVENGLAIFINDPLVFRPDDSFAYSTFGYSLASRVMEAAAGEDFLTLTDRLLVEPLGLSATAPDRSLPPIENRVEDYISLPRRGGVFPAPATNSSYKWAGGGFASTPGDLARFGAAVMAGDVVSPDHFVEMTTPRLVASGVENVQKYGLGWRSAGMTYPRGSEATLPIVHHGGTAAGGECILLLLPEEKLAAAMCGNAFTGGSDDLLRLAVKATREFLAARPAAGAAVE